MNANTALKINDAIHQAVSCGESVTEIKEQVSRAILAAQREQAIARVREAQKDLEALGRIDPLEEARKGGWEES